MFGLIEIVVGGAKDWFLNRQKIAAAEAENRARLLQAEATHNNDWEMASLADKDKWLRRTSFFMFAAPFIWALFDPEGVRFYFSETLTAMPEWYVQTFMSMIGGVWGIAALKNTLPSLVQGVTRAIRGQ